MNMIVLRVKEKGHLISIPGMNPVRSPVEVDISKFNMDLIVTKLRSQGIKNYEITEKDDDPIKKVEKKEKDVVDKSYKQEINKRFNGLEKMIYELVENKYGNIDENKEQITDKLDLLESLTRDLLTKQRDVILTEKLLEKEPEIEEMDRFIPEVNTKGMILKGSNTKTTIQQDDIDQDEVDLLSKLLDKKS
jgi:hypothetical protein